MYAATEATYGAGTGPLPLAQFLGVFHAPGTVGDGFLIGGMFLVGGVFAGRRVGLGVRFVGDGPWEHTIDRRGRDLITGMHDCLLYE